MEHKQKIYMFLLTARKQRKLRPSLHIFFNQNLCYITNKIEKSTKKPFMNLLLPFLMLREKKIIISLIP